MLLELPKSRLDVRSTEEMTIDELCFLRETLETSETIRRYVSEHRPRRGGRVFGLVSLLLLYLLMECRKTTYRGVIRNLSDHDCICLGLIDENGRPRRPSYATLNGFVNRVLAPMAEAIGEEITEAVLKTSLRTYTLDSTPLQASRYNKDAEYSTHYEIRMDKAHILMADGYPLYMLQSDGNANDSPFAAPLIGRLPRARPSHGKMEFHADGAYDSFLTYSRVYVSTGAVLRCNQGTDAVVHGVDEAAIRSEYAGMWQRDGYDPYRKNDLDFMLRFLCKNGREELVGKHLRDRSTRMNEAEEKEAVDERTGGRKNVRHVCETMHRAMRRWVDLSIFRLVKRTKEARIRCRFLCLQLLSLLFRGYVSS